MQPSAAVRLALLLSALVILSACPGGGDAVDPGDAVDTAAQSTTADDVPTGSRKGQRAPSFELPFLSGGKGHLSLTDLRGKVVLVTFWASWCGPCRMEVPALDKHWAKLRTRDVVILGISIDDKKAAATDFLDRYPVDYPMLLDEAGGTVANTWGVSSIPATILIDKDGVVQDRHLGYSPTMLANTMRDISELLQE